VFRHAFGEDGVVWVLAHEVLSQSPQFGSRCFVAKQKSMWEDAS